MPTSNGQPRRLEACRAQALRRTPRRQRGVALILVLMLVVTASAFVMLSALNNRASRETAQRLVTAEALGQARRALIGYAVGYADGVHTPDKGPGRLPCPDLLGGSDPGVAESTGDCRAASDRETGLLPYRTLGLTTLADGSGAPLWYAVSENFRSMVTTPVNSDDGGCLQCRRHRRRGGRDHRARRGAERPGAHRSANAYTAGRVAGGRQRQTLGDNRYTRLASAANNDTVMVITRGELMAEVVPRSCSRSRSRARQLLQRPRRRRRRAGEWRRP
jgi:type II secretory pathway pseudopilin PulG